MVMPSSDIYRIDNLKFKFNAIITFSTEHHEKGTHPMMACLISPKIGHSIRLDIL